MAASLSAMPGFATARLSLRPLGPGDAAAFHALTDDPAILDMVHFLSQPFTLADAAQLLAGEGDGRDCFWGVFDGPALVGTVGTHLRGDQEIELGYWFAPAARGQGFAAEAATGMIETLRAAWPGRRLVAECRPENRPSWRLLEKLGFRSDGSDGARPGRKRFTF
ncbi:GNAT family N-acetyltransferase [Pelagibacterium lacus]|uniref:N-acetyltransferase n=1 Tax=Pelagibacterium lacus TaxID=2282655 RepID=A0A369W2C6_9HYPH|nr:GNAT family N-acetyltransferase [Pelagibacterium lacus]RDE08189.1 N-acetyltransferase [Pelagibacterium lacus]